MKTYILSIAGVVLLTAIISIVVPNGKMGKFIQGMGKLLTLTVMIAPFATLFMKQKGELAFSSANIAADERYLVSCARILSERDEEEIKKALNDEISVTAEVEVERGKTAGFPSEKITVKITDFGIIGQDGHKNMIDEIESRLATRYRCKVEIS